MVDSLPSTPGLSSSESLFKLSQSVKSHEHPSPTLERPPSMASVEAVASSKKAPLEELFGQSVPSELQGNQVTMAIEWGWRRLLLDTISQLPTSMMAQNIGQESIQTLWKLLIPLLSETNSSSMKGIESLLPNFPPGTLLPFAMMAKEVIAQAPNKKRVERFLLAHKLQQSVKMMGQPIQGEGVFFPPLRTGDERAGKVVRWTAHRESYQDEQQGTIQRLVLSLNLEEVPFEIQFVHGAQRLAIHVKTDDEAWRSKIMMWQQELRSSLQAKGYASCELSAGSFQEWITEA